MGGLWMVYDHYLEVQPWSRKFSIEEAHLSNIIAWILLPGLYYHYYIKVLMLELAEVSGRVVKMDYNTTDGKRGKFAMIAVVVDLSKPLILFLGIDRKKQAVVYEGLPSICYDCSRVGHIKENCKLNPSEKKTDTLSTAMEEMMNHTLVNLMRNKENRSNDPRLYEPWMQLTSGRSRNLTALEGMVEDL
ncbi:hypothetical protein PVK06_039243 [Gossypium arboreum]|uniref:CCHC-type domain-containing protein n=1 Tax=Gossypium arboreum TaxID=29729 RepID=A0ABR0N2L0_GOSAR|nr:hypothetical protein PVK06_039243 [Gossypium arboreum]